MSVLLEGNIRKKVLDGLTTLLPPSSNSSWQTLVVNKFGDSIALDSEHDLYLVKLRSPSESAPTPIKILLDKDIKPYRFTRIEFNKDGRRLLLTSSTALGVVEIPDNFIVYGEIDIEKLQKGQCLFEELHLQNVKSIIKASFHSLSDYHIVALIKEESGTYLKVLSILSLSTNSTSISLGLRTDFVSYCFGNEYDWSYLTVFLVAKDGKIFYLCPVLPEGAILPITAVDALRLWDEEEKSRTPKMTSTYLNAAFSSASPSSSSSSTAFIRAGQGFRDTWKSEVAAKQYQTLFEAEPLLQGPLIIKTSTGATTTPPAAAIDPTHALPTAVDICMPQMPRGAPVLIVSFSDGRLVYMMPDQHSVSFFVGPCWTTVSASNYPPLPSMLTVETVYLQDPKEAPMTCHLIPDPMRGEYLHIVNVTKQEVYLLQSSWLNQAMTGGAKTSSHMLRPADCMPLYAPSAPAGIAGFCVLTDAMVGHQAIVRSSTGTVSVVNIHDLMFRMNSRMKNHAQIDRDIQIDRLPFLTLADQLSVRIVEDIDKCPIPDSEGSSTAAAIDKCTLSATRHLDAVTDNLTQYAHRVIMLLDSLRDHHDKQAQDILDAKKQLALQLKTQTELEARLESTVKMLADRKKRALAVLRHQAAVGQAKLLPCEQAFEAELVDWMCQAAHMEANIKVGMIYHVENTQFMFCSHDSFVYARVLQSLQKQALLDSKKVDLDVYPHSSQPNSAARGGAGAGGRLAASSPEPSPILTSINSTPGTPQGQGERSSPYPGSSLGRGLATHRVNLRTPGRQGVSALLSTPGSSSKEKSVEVFTEEESVAVSALSDRIASLLHDVQIKLDASLG